MTPRLALHSSALTLSALGLASGCSHREPQPRLACTANELVDDGVCVPAACGLGTWGSLPENAVHVQSGASDGDGSRGAPLADIQAGLDAVADGGFVAVAAGVYPGAVIAPVTASPVTLAGRCSVLVTLDAEGVEDTATIDVSGGRATPDFTLQGVTVTGGTDFGLRAEDAVVTVTDSMFRANSWVGIGANGSGTSVTLADTQVETTTGRSGRDDDESAYGVYAGGGASLEFTRGSVTGTEGYALFASGGRVTLTDVDVVDTKPTSDGSGGFGLSVRDGSNVVCVGCTIRGGANAGVYVEDASLTLSSSSISEVGEGASSGEGIHARGTSTLALDGVTISECLAAGIFIADEVAATVDNTTIRSISATSSAIPGVGIEVIDNATLSASSLVISETTGAGLLVFGGAATLEDVTIENAGFHGLEVDGGAAVHAQRLSVKGALGAGILVDAAELTLDDCQIDGSLPYTDGDGDAGDGGGDGIVVQAGGHVLATSTRFTANSEAGVLATDEGTLVELESCEVLDTLEPESVVGAGVQAETGAEVRISGGVISGNSGVGVRAVGGIVTLDGCTIRDTEPVGDLGGYGVALYYGATGSLTGVSVEGNVGIGVQVWDATASVTGSTIRLNRSQDDGSGGGGLEANEGAVVNVAGCTFDENEGRGLFAYGAGTTVTVLDTELTATSRPRLVGLGAGLGAQSGAKVDADGISVTGTHGPGLYVADGGTMSCSECLLDSNAFAGAVAAGGALSLSSSVLSANGSDAEYGGGFGVYAAPDTTGNTVTLRDSEVGPHAYAGLWLDGNGSYDVERSTLSGGEPLTGTTLGGYAVFAQSGVTPWDEGQGLRLVGNLISGADEVAIMLNSASATFAENTWDANGTDVWQQVCDGITPLGAEDLAGVPASTICPLANRLIPYDLTFDTVYLPNVQTQE